MPTWVYKCNECDKTFTEEVEAGQTPPENADCPFCESKDADKVFEIPEMSGGCGCGGGCC